MRSPSEELIGLYRRMSEITAPECANSCRVPLSCCDLMYCEMTAEFARERYGVVLIPTGHPKLLFMGSDGCVVAPHLRPLCTLHTCAVNSFGCKPGDERWTAEYFQLRDEIEVLEWRSR